MSESLRYSSNWRRRRNHPFLNLPFGQSPASNRLHRFLAQDMSAGRAVPGRGQRLPPRVVWRYNPLRKLTPVAPQELPTNRRRFILGTGIFGAGLIGVNNAEAGLSQLDSASDLGPHLNLEEKSVAFSVPPLPYSFDALEPHIDAKTMEIHHDKHHAAYVTNLNKALEGHADLQSKSLEDLLKSLDALPEAIRNPVRNNAGGHWNHSLFWTQMTKARGGESNGELADAIKSTFGSFED